MMRTTSARPRPAPPRVLLGLLVVGLLPATACKTDATQIVVRVDSDMLVPAELASVRASVYAEIRKDADPISREIFPLTAESLPLSFGVAPSGEADGVVVITVDALDEAGTVLFTERAVTAFVKEKTLLLDVDLLASCVGMYPCQQPSATCRKGICQSEMRDELSEIEGGTELQNHTRPKRDAGITIRDSGVLDSGEPAPSDAGIRDATTVADTGVPMGNLCTAPTDTCTIDKCPPGAQGCVCADTPTGFKCIASCSTANMTCPNGLRCNGPQMVCTP